MGEVGLTDVCVCVLYIYIYCLIDDTFLWWTTNVYVVFVMFVQRSEFSSGSTVRISFYYYISLIFYYYYCYCILCMPDNLKGKVQGF